MKSCTQAFLASSVLKRGPRASRATATVFYRGGAINKILVAHKREIYYNQPYLEVIHGDVSWLVGLSQAVQEFDETVLVFQVLHDVAKGSHESHRVGTEGG